MRQAPSLVSIVVGILLFWGGAEAAEVNFKADLNGASEVPAVNTTGKGAATASLDTTTKTLTWTVTYSGLTGPTTAAHIHGPAAAGANAGVLVPLSGNLASPIKGSATLTDAQISGRIVTFFRDGGTVPRSRDLRPAQAGQSGSIVGRSARTSRWRGRKGNLRTLGGSCRGRRR